MSKLNDSTGNKNDKHNPSEESINSDKIVKDLLVSGMWEAVESKSNKSICSIYEKDFKNLQNNNVKQKNLSAVYKDLCLNGKMKYIMDELSDQNFKTEYLYRSEVHGKKHNERVTFFSVAIAHYEKMPDDYTRILTDAAKYHDIGRIDDWEDKLHGERSSKKIEEHKIVEYKNPEDFEILKYIVTNHSITDKDALQNVKNYKISNTQKAIGLLKVFKDADALDRVRICDLDPKYLRTDSSKMLVKSAFQLYPRSKELFNYEGSFDGEKVDKLGKDESNTKLEHTRESMSVKDALKILNSYNQKEANPGTKSKGKTETIKKECKDILDF